MQERFGRQSWARVLRRFRRRRPMTPIRRKPPGLELVRLDDRIAPGSVWATAAAQAVALGGPLAWIGLGESELSAVGDLRPLPTVAGPNDSPADGDPSNIFSEPFFSRTSADSENTDGQADRQRTADSDHLSSQTTFLADLGEPGEDGPALPGRLAEPSLSEIGSPAGGSIDVEHSDQPGGIRSAGVPTSISLPSPSPTDTAGQISPSPLRGGGGGRGSSTAVTPTPVAHAPGSPKPSSAPVGRLGGRLQALFHTGDSAAGSFNLSDTANRQGQIGSLIGGQLTDGTSAVLGFNTSPSHRPASLLGQAMSAGSDQSPGLRTSKASSGPFGLVGTQSVGDMISGHGPHGGGLLGGPDMIAAAIPTNGSLPEPGLAHVLGTAGTHVRGPDPAVGLPGAVLAPANGRGRSGGKAGPRRQDPTVTPGAFVLTFSLAEQWDDPNNGTYSLSEHGTVSFIGLTGGSAEDYGSDYVYAEISGNVHFNGGIENLNWYGYADPGGLLYGSDFDQFNQGAFGAPSPSAAASYVYDSNGDVPLTVTDTGSTTEHNGNVTTQHGLNNSATGDENVTIHDERTAGTRQITIDDTTNTNFHDHDDGTDDDPATSTKPDSQHDSFTDTANGTSTETDHIEGTIGDDGTFHVTSFSIDITDDFDFSDTVNGTETTPETGGAETDTFSDGDSGHDHDHLHASGTVNDWTATLDDNAGDTFSDYDTGADNTSVTTDGVTESNHASFHGGDSGTDSDLFHLEVHGTDTTFTVTNVSDEIHDVYDFNDVDDGTAADQSTPETDSDHFHGTDGGHADEKLTIGDDGDSLTAAYTDTAHDDFTDTDAEHDGWSRSGTLSGGLVVPGGGGGSGTDTGHDDATDGDDGGEDLSVGVDASMPNWQSTNPDNPPPTWQITSVDATVHGSANVHAHDDDTDTAARGQDSAGEHVSDDSTGTDHFDASIEGTGASATLTKNTHYTLTNQSEDDTTDNWDDPAQVNGAAASDDGSEAVDITDHDTAHVDVQKIGNINAQGAITPTVTTVHVGDDATIDETNDGGETIDDGSHVITSNEDPSGIDPATGEYVAGVNRETEQVHGTDHITDGVGIDATTNAAGTVVGVNQNLDGDIGFSGTENMLDSLNTYDELANNIGGNLGGHVRGKLHQAGIVAGNQLTPTGSDGDFTLEVGGGCGDTEIEKFDTRPSGGIPAKIHDLIPQESTVVASIPVTNGGGWIPYDDPANAQHYPVLSQLPEWVKVTYTHSLTVPEFHLDESDGDISQNWGLNSLDFHQRATDTTSVTGTYTNCLFTNADIVASGDATVSTTSETETTEKTQGGDTSKVTGEQKTTTTSKMDTDGTISVGGDFTSGDIHMHSKLTDVEDVTGTGSGRTAADLYISHDASGNSTFNYQLWWNHPGAMSGYRIFTLAGVRDYHTREHVPAGQVDANGNPVQLLYDAYGTDTLSQDYIFHTTVSGGMTVDFNEHRRGGENHEYDDGEVAEDYFFPAGASWTETVIGVDGGPWSNSNPGTPPGPVDHRDWFAKAADFAAGMGDAVSCGLTQRIRQAAGYDDVVDKNSGWYKGGEIAGTAVAIAAGGVNPCGATKAIGGMVRAVSAVQGAGQLANAAEAAKNGDPLGFALNVVGARMAFSKMNSACFAAGTPIRTPDGHKPIEQLEPGDLVLTRAEFRPESEVVARAVLRTIVNECRVMRLHVSGQVIRTTAEHPFFVRGRGWDSAQNLTPGDELLAEDGAWVRCAAAVLTAETEAVYNVEIVEHHTYFVGSADWGFAVWAHNDCLTYNQLRRQLAGSGKQSHHLIEKRFAGLFGQRPGQMLSTGLDKAQHQVFTNRWRALIPYGAGTAEATRESVTAAAREVYKDFPQYLRALGL